ncbi:MAG: tetratricopeptide repeat protein [Actinophytocola sp.]|uniref:ATP-binding protein n=1 Tax=Actinophytocola sp. TaxID=1872138 RepID=UPI001324694F|nr:helix-turn-helix domain-containing protein [Actinophytocola sp.]MPZ83855.1 tetratricopeptide repeat protein [Actinophytocola sp.]
MQDRRDDGASPFAEELERLLRKRGLSWRRLSDLIGYTPSWLSKIKHGAPPSAELARKCDQVLEADGQLIALAAPSSSPMRLAQLPAAAATFVGRGTELLALANALEGVGEPGTPQTVAIDGPPGAGKTALALRVAHRVVESYSDGQLYVDLRGYSPDGHPRVVDEVLEEFLTALGVQLDVIPAGLEARAKLYRSVLADRRVLVVLDNAADSQQLQPLMPASAGCGVVVTSRKRLGGLAINGDRRITLGPMAEEESITLLHKVIGTERAAAEPDAVRALAGRCDHLPLALRIAAERVATHPHHSVSLLVEELAIEEERLEALATDDSVAVKTVFSWSYRDLSADAARMFRLIGLHTGPHVRAGAAAALAGQSVVRARRLLDRLAGVHLLEGLGPDRYRMHDLLRVYAAEQAVAEEPEEQRELALRRVVDWYLHNTYAANHMLAPQRHDPVLDKSEFDVDVTDFDYDSALEWCEIEMSNIATATRTAVEVGENVAGWKLPAGSFNYLHLRKRWTSWVASHEVGVIGARRAGDRYGEAWVLNNLAVAYRELRRIDEAKECFLQARALRIELGDKVGQAWSLTGIGYIGFDQSRFDAAALHFGEALDIFREVGDRHGEGIALANVGDAYRCLKDYDKAVDALERALTLFRDIEDRYGECYTLVKLGDTYAELARQTDALDCFERALQTRHDLGDRWGEGEVLHRQGLLLHDSGQPELAGKSLRAAFEIFDELGDPRAIDLRELLSRTG